MADENGFEELQSGWEEIAKESRPQITPDPIDYKNFFQSGHNLLFVADKKGVLLEVNDCCDSLLGYSSKELIGNNIIDIVFAAERENVATIFNNASAQNNKITFMCFIVSRNLSLKSAEWNVILVDELFYGCIRDITELKKMEEQFYQLHEKFQLILDHIPLPVYWKDNSSRYLGCNGEFAKIAGLTDPSELIGKTDYELPWKDIADVYIQNDSEIISTGEPQLGLERKLTVADESIWIKINKIPLHDKENNIIGVLGAFEDITKEKVELYAIKDSEMRFRTLFENSFDAIGVSSSDGKHIYVNEAYVKLFGYDNHEEVLCLPVINFIADDNKEKASNIWQKRVQGEKAPNIYNVNGLRKDGTQFILNLHVSVFEYNGETMTLAILRDITESKKTEERLRERESTLRALFDSITEFAVLVDVNGNINLANETAARLFETSVEEITGRCLFDIIDRKFFESERNYFSEIIHSKKSVRFEENTDGIVNDITIYPVFDEGNSVSQFVIVRVDITEQRNVIEALRERDAMLSALINATTESALLIDANGKILTANETVAKRYGTSQSDFIGQFLFDLLTLRGAEVRKKHIDYVMESGNPVRYEENRGNIILDTSIYPIFNGEGKVIQLAIYATDITKKKKAEDEITEMNNKLIELNSTKDKFFSIIAHDMRSPFQGLIGYSQILIDDYEELSEEERKFYIHNIGEISKSTYKLLENLLQWSRMQTGNFEFNPEVFNVAEEIEPTLALLRTTASNKNISIESFIKPKTYLMADKNMLNTIIRNLISNSIKFTKPGGKISVYTKELNNNIVFTIKDEGVGMSKDKLLLLFKPAKNISTLGTENERGTGLGLLLCKEMVEKHQGEIWAESEVGQGSSFYFTMPVRV